MNEEEFLASIILMGAIQTLRNHWRISLSDWNTLTIFLRNGKVDMDTTHGRTWLKRTMPIALRVIRKEVYGG